MDFRGTYKGGGGPDKTILNSAAQHDTKKVDVLVTYLRDPKDEEYSIDKWAKSLGIEYVDIPDAKLIDFSCIKKLKRLIDQHDIQLIHSHDAKTLLYGWLLKKQRPALHLMYTIHLHQAYKRNDFPTLQSFLRFRLRQKIQVLLMKQYRKPLLAVSENTRQCVIADGISDEDIEVLHNGIDINKWRRKVGTPTLRQELKITNDTFLVGTVARIAQQHKDLPTFYKVAAKIVNKDQRVKFVIVGDGHGNELRKAQQEVVDLGLQDTLFFTGHRTDLLDVYTSLDIFLMTSITEGLPNTVLEAMAMEVPVVSTAVAGVPELVTDRKTGFLAPVRDVDQLAQHVLMLLQDSKLRQNFANAARKRIEDKFSFKERVMKMEEYYKAFMERSC
jgi:glycosyltransferase involved in cell wall biosynthesis